MSFLPNDYEVPQKPGNYMKFKDGENRFRILASPIVGWIYWKTEADGARRPVRKRSDDKIIMSDVEDGEDSVKHFWAMPVWNYTEKRVQILELTQRTIQTEIKALTKNAKWGSPINYDLAVIKTGQKLETKYSIFPEPPTVLSKEIAEEFKNSNINLEALYEGKDPFKSDEIESVSVVSAATRN